MAASAPLAAENATEAQMWLERMALAAQSLNYDGTFVYRNGTQMESMRIIHRADEHGQRSRLVSLSGTKREVLRDGQQVICILPDDKSVVVAKVRPPRFFSSSFLVTRPGFTDFYSLSDTGKDRVAGRPTQIIDLSPKDEYRYGYRLWVDKDTGLLLKSDLIGERGVPIEQFIYTSISMPPLIPDSLLEPGISGRAFTWYTPASAEERREAPSSDWKVTWLPQGFMMNGHANEPVFTSDAVVEQMVYTDGLASLSVFIERVGGGDALEGLSNMGALNAFGRVVEGHQVTVVGEVPAHTVEEVAASVVRE